MRLVRGLLIGLMVVAAVLARDRIDGGRADGPGSGQDDPGTPGAIVDTRGEQRVAQLFEMRRSGEIIDLAGTIEALLPDDNDGSRHQRFILRLSTGQTLLVAHNIDLAPRVPAGEGDRIQLRGEYEWNAQGGVLHWTHDDPAGRHVDGWIEFNGQRYR